MAAVQGDMAYWAGTNDAQHRTACYGPDQSQWPGCPPGVTDASTGLTVPCLKTLWQAAGCTNTVDAFSDPSKVRALQRSTG